jgi:hypothetical protein
MSHQCQAKMSFFRGAGSNGALSLEPLRKLLSAKAYLYVIKNLRGKKPHRIKYIIYKNSQQDKSKVIRILAKFTDFVV